MALTDNLVAFWKLDEASGSRADSVGSNTLTDVNTVTSNPGKVGTAAQLTAANSEYLTIGTPASVLEPGDIPFMVACWVYADTLTTSYHRAIVDKGNGDWILYYNKDYLRFSLNGNFTSTYPEVLSDVYPATGIWYFVVAWTDPVANTINIQVNNGPVQTAAVNNGGVPVNSTHPFSLGTRASAGWYWDGRIDEVGVWNRILSAPERTQLYNCGLGASHPFTTLGLRGDLFAYWKLDEVSGSRRDSVGAETLTDVNTVASAAGLLGNAASYVKANNESLQRAADAVINTGDIDYTFNFWLKWGTDPQSVQGWPIVMSKDSAGLSNSAEFNLGWDNGVNNLQWEVFAGGGAGVRPKIAGVYASPRPGSTGVWYMITVDHSATLNTIGIRINGGTRTSAATSGASGTTTNPFLLSGRQADGWYIEGLIDEVGYWKRSLTDAEALQLYNSGNALSYPFTALTQSLVSYWQLEETSGSRADAIGGATLTDYNTVTSNPGKQGTASQHTAANSEGLYLAGAAQAGDVAFTLTAWVYLDSLGAWHQIAGRSNGVTGQSEYCLTVSDTNYPGFECYDAGGWHGAYADFTLAASTWYWLCGWHDPTTNTIYLQINNTGTIYTAALAAGTSVISQNFMIGGKSDGAGSWHNGRIDEVGFWKRLLTTTERTQLYNAGAGLAWPLLDPATNVTFLAGVMAA